MLTKNKYKETMNLNDIGIFPNHLIRKNKNKGYGIFKMRPINIETLLMRYAGKIKYAKDVDL